MSKRESESVRLTDGLSEYELREAAHHCTAEATSNDSDTCEFCGGEDMTVEVRRHPYHMFKTPRWRTQTLEVTSEPLFEGGPEMSLHHACRRMLSDVVLGQIREWREEVRLENEDAQR